MIHLQNHVQSRNSLLLIQKVEFGISIWKKDLCNEIWGNIPVSELLYRTGETTEQNQSPICHSALKQNKSEIIKQYLIGHIKVLFQPDCIFRRHLLLIHNRLLYKCICLLYILDTPITWYNNKKNPASHQGWNGQIIFICELFQNNRPYNSIHQSTSKINYLIVIHQASMFSNFQLEILITFFVLEYINTSILLQNKINGLYHVIYQFHLVNF
jgi:hypothetical protein